MIPPDLPALVEAGHSDPELAARFGVSARTVLRWRTRYNLPSRWQPVRPPHGTERRYRLRSDPCRCVACRAAHATAHGLWRRQRAYTSWSTREEPSEP